MLSSHSGGLTFGFGQLTLNLGFKAAGLSSLESSLVHEH